MTGVIAGTSTLNFGGIEMAGVVAGTSTLDLKQTKGIDLVTLTVNNNCNMQCPHCYLQYDGPKEYAGLNILDAVVKEDFRHLSIVGKEPLFDREHARKTLNLIEQAHKSGKTVSLITNGLNLEYLDDLDNPEQLAFADVSFDGGPKTYSKIRKANYSKLIKKINASKVNRNALHTLHSGNVNNIDDMMRIESDAQFRIIMFSPYLESDARTKVEAAPISSLLEQLVNSKEFMDSKQALLNLDVYHAKQYGFTMAEIKNQLKKLGLAEKTALFKTDLLRQGVVRVTYDGYVLSPEESLHTSKYSAGIKLNGDLSKAYKELLNS